MKRRLVRVGDRVLPRNEPLTDKGPMWEWHLMQCGWNGVPVGERVGKVEDIWYLGGGEKVVDVRWWAKGRGNTLSRAVFPAELRRDRAVKAK